MCPLHPTCNDADPHDLATNDDDVENIRSITRGLVGQGKRIIALMHSYGGLVGSAALGEFVAAQENGDSGDQEKRGGVVALMYMTAFIPFETECLAAIFGGQFPPFLTPDDKSPYILISDPQQHFYHDLPKEEQDKWTRELVRHSIPVSYTAPSFKGKNGEADRTSAWRHMSGRTWYLVCENDQALPAFLQRMMIKRIEEEGCKVNEELCQGSHSPFLSMPEEVGKVVEKVAQAVQSA